MDKKQWMGLFIAFVMISSVFGFVASYGSSKGQTVKYNGIKFVIVNDQYRTSIDGVQHNFIFFPGDIEYIQLSDKVKQLLTSPVISVTYDPSSELAENLAESQFYFNTQLRNKLVVEIAVTDDSTVQLPVKSCADSTISNPVIELRKGNQSSITAENSCIVVSALDSFDLYQLTERLVFTSLGVMS